MPGMAPITVRAAPKLHHYKASEKTMPVDAIMPDVIENRDADGRR